MTLRNRLALNEIKPRCGLPGRLLHAFVPTVEARSCLRTLFEKCVSQLAQLDGAAAHFILESRLNGDHDLLLVRDGLWARQSDMENVRSPVASRREMSRLFYESLTCRLRLEFFGAFVNCHPRPLLGTHDQANLNEPVSPATAGGADRMWYQWRARMSLHRNDIAKSGVVHTSRRRYSPLSFRPASDGRVDSAMAAAPPNESAGTASAHRPQA